MLTGTEELQAVKEKVLAAMAALLALPPSDPHHLLRTNVPSFRKCEHAVTIGRVSLSRNAPNARIATLVDAAAGMAGQGAHPSPFAHTGHSLRLMHAVAAAVAQNECLLLVGEAGTGKTALIQHLADLVCAALMPTCNCKGFECLKS
jgi:midasin